MARRSAVASTGKLSEAQLDSIRSGFGSASLGICQRQIERILAGQCWADGWKPNRCENDIKLCRICGTEYSRRFPSGRYRSDKLWSQKETCGNSCQVKLMWQRKQFKRSKP